MSISPSQKEPHTAAREHHDSSPEKSLELGEQVEAEGEDRKQLASTKAFSGWLVLNFAVRKMQNALVPQGVYKLTFLCRRAPRAPCSFHFSPLPSRQRPTPWVTPLEPMTLAPWRAPCCAQSASVPVMSTI